MQDAILIHVPGPSDFEFSNLNFGLRISHMASVRLEKIDKVYPNGKEAVRGIDLDVGDGELVVLVGPSGCGKTTILRIIAGLETPTDGRVFLDGNDVTSWPPRQRDVAMVFQSYSLYPHKNVRDNLG